MSIRSTLYPIRMATLTLQSRLRLRDGNEMPIIGFGTYELDGKDAYNAVKWALEAGYRLIDSAAWYYNEKECGRAILDFCQSTGTPRADIFYTTKLQSNNGYSSVRKAIQDSLAACGLGYIDLYLIHGPIGGTKARQESWRAICDAQKGGGLKSVGISTFGVRHMKEILDMGLAVPAVHQIDLHPFMTRMDVVTFCKDHDIVLEAWGPLVRGMRFRHPIIANLAHKYSKSPSQVLLRYSLQKGYVPIPKSADRARIVANLLIFDFELTSEEVIALDGLDEELVTDWDPTHCA